MASQDDRKEFLQRSQALGTELAADESLRLLDNEIIARADRHGYSYLWTWLGAPIIQMPSDIVAMQEVIWRTRPDAVIETGFARGGSALLYASILELLGAGVVVAVDIDIRPHNREAVTEHPLGKRVRFVEGDSTDSAILDRVRDSVGDAQRVMVVLDSDHTHQHVLRELRAYAPFVTPGQFLVVADTVVEQIPVQDHRPRRWGPGDNPQSALDEWLQGEADRWEIDTINDKLLMSSSRGGYLRRRR